MYVRQVLEAVSSPGTGTGTETVMESAQALLFDALPWLTYTAVCFTFTDQGQLVLGASSSRAGPRDARKPGCSFKSGPIIVGYPPGGTLTARRRCSLMIPDYKANHSLTFNGAKDTSYIELKKRGIRDWSSTPVII